MWHPVGAKRWPWKILWILSHYSSSVFNVRSERGIPVSQKMKFEKKKRQLVWEGSWKALKSRVETDFKTEDHWIFRGEQVDRKDLTNDSQGAKSARLTLRTSFDKRWDDLSTAQKSARPRYETHLLREFKRAAHHYHDDELPDKADFLAWLALARHHEMPCRLLDCSYSFWVAAYFACFEKRKDNYGIIVAVNGKKLIKKIEDQVRKGGVDTPRFLWDGDEVPDCFREPETRDFHNPKFFWRYAIKTCATKVDDRIPIAQVNPGHMSDRQIAQQGVFLCQANMIETFQEAFDRLVLQLEPGFVKAVVLQPSMTTEIVTDLSAMNIKGSVLFPDLTGFGRSLARHLCEPIGESLRHELVVAGSEEPRW